MASDSDASPEQAVGAHEPMVLSDNDQTKKFINVVCKDTDLLLLSDRVQNSVREVGGCLGLEEGEMEEIENRDCAHSVKIYSAFMAWNEKNQTEDRTFTWGELTRCLTTSRKYDFLETVTNFLVTCPPRIEGQIRFLLTFSNLFFLQMSKRSCIGTVGCA